MQPLDRPLSQQSLPNQPGVQNQQMTQSPARQRVLFVLRVVDGDQSTPPTANIEGKPQSDAAKSPSEPAAPPAKGPAQEK